MPPGNRRRGRDEDGIVLSLNQEQYDRLFHDYDDMKKLVVNLCAEVELERNKLRMEKKRTQELMNRLLQYEDPPTRGQSVEPQHEVNSRGKAFGLGRW